MGPGFLIDAAGATDTAHGGSTTSSLITDLGVPGFVESDYADLINAALDNWAAVSGFTNLGQVADGAADAGAPEASGGNLGDIRVAAWKINKPTVLAHAFQPGTESIFTDGTIAGDLHIDVPRTWVDEPNDSVLDADCDVFTVVLHELGHSLGLGHSSVTGSVMESTYPGGRRTLHADDIAGIQALYGIPDPGTMLLMVLGGVALMRRHRSARRSLANRVRA